MDSRRYGRFHVSIEGFFIHSHAIFLSTLRMQFRINLCFGKCRFKFFLLLVLISDHPDHVLGFRVIQLSLVYPNFFLELSLTQVFSIFFIRRFRAFHFFETLLCLFELEFGFAFLTLAAL